MMSAACPICEFSKRSSVIRIPDAQLFQLIEVGRSPSEGDFSFLEVSKCLACGHVFNSEFLDSLGERMYSGDIVSNVPVDVSMTRNLETIVDWIGIDAYSGRAVLEVGGGSGHVARLLARHSQSVDVFEPSAGVRVETVSEPNIQWTRDIFRGGGGSQYGFAVCRQVLEHVRQPRFLLQSIVNTLAPDGAFYVEVPNRSYIEERGAVFDFHLAHVQYFNRTGLEALCGLVGLTCERAWELKNGHDIGLFLRKNSTEKRVPDLKTVEEFNFSDRLSSRLSRVREEIRELDGEVALYGATWQGLSFLSQVDRERVFSVVFDDNPDFHGKTIYSRRQAIEVREPGTDAWGEIKHIVITAYLHERAIADKLRHWGFRGQIWSIGSASAAQGLTFFLK